MKNKVTLRSRVSVQQADFVNAPEQFPAFVGGFGCVRDSTEIATPSGFVCVADLSAGGEVLSWSEKNHVFQRAPASGAFPKGKANLFRVITAQGEFVASGHHRVRVPSGSYQPVESLRAGMVLSGFGSGHQLTSKEFDRIWSPEDDLSYWEKLASYLDDCEGGANQCDPRLRLAVDSVLASFPLQAGAHKSGQCFSPEALAQMGGLEALKQTHTRLGQCGDRQRIESSTFLAAALARGAVDQTLKEFVAHIFELIRQFVQSALTCGNHQLEILFAQCEQSPLAFSALARQSLLPVVEGSFHEQALARMPGFCQQGLRFVEQSGCRQSIAKFWRAVQGLDLSYRSTIKTPIIRIERLGRKEWYWDLHVAGNNNYLTKDGVVHHNSGKTGAGILRALALKFRYPQQDVAYYLPTYDLVRMIGYPRFSEALTNAQAKFALNKADHVLSIKGKGQIIFRTLDNPDRIVGYEVADSIVDELDTLKQADAEHAWRQIIARNRQKKPDGALNTVGVATTPEGFRFVYDRWAKNPADGYRLIHASTYSNERNLPDGYIDSLKRSYPPQLISAYLEGQFVNLTSGAVYPDFSRIENHTDEVIADGEELHIGLDFNVYNCTAVVGVIRSGSPMILAELVKMRDTPHVIETIKEKYAGHKINIYPDASGQSNKTVNATESDILLLNRAGFRVNVPTKNPFIKERVMAVNALICNSANERKLRINTLLAPTITECLEQQIYDQNGEPDKSDGKDHGPDALGYLIHFLWPIVRQTVQRVKILGM